MNGAFSSHYRETRHDDRAVRALGFVVKQTFFGTLRLLSCDIRRLVTYAVPVVFIVGFAVFAALFGAFSGVIPQRDTSEYYAAVNLMLTLLFGLISFSAVGTDALTDDRLTLLHLGAKPRVLVGMLKSLRPAWWVTICIIMQYGCMSAAYGIGFAELVGLLFSILLCAVAALLTRTIIFVVTFGKRKVVPLVSLVGYGTLAVWAFVADLLTYDSGLAAALISPFGTTLPVGGWCVSVMYGIHIGSFPATLVGLLLYPSYLALTVLIFVALKSERFENAVVIMGINGRVRNRVMRPKLGIKLRTLCIKYIENAKIFTPKLRAELCAILEGGGKTPYIMSLVRTFAACAVFAVFIPHDLGDPFKAAILTNVAIFCRLFTFPKPQDRQTPTAAAAALTTFVRSLAAAIPSLCIPLAFMGAAPTVAVCAVAACVVAETVLETVQTKSARCW